MSTLTSLQTAFYILIAAWTIIALILAKRGLKRYAERTIIAKPPPQKFRGKNLSVPKTPMTTTTTTTQAAPVVLPKPQPQPQPSIANWGDYLDDKPPDEETIYKP